jgi:hypothetical protein
VEEDMEEDEVTKKKKREEKTKRLSNERVVD